MKHLTRFVVSCLAACGLAYSAVSHATDVSTRPLKADVLVKPNVVFAMDDSGSMDWEILLDTNSGILQWLDGSKRAWDSTGKFEVTDQYSMSYLFPNGTGVGGMMFAEDNTNGRAVPPSPQFASLRSSDFNPIYYNPKKTYKPWPAAYHDSLLQTYSDQSPTAAKSHPAMALSITMDLTADEKRTFYYRNGMMLPDGSTAGSNGTASSTYFPATYWELDAGCTLDATETWTSNCVRAPGYSSTDAQRSKLRLKRHEIKPANYASTAEYKAAIQNFANWWSYYRKRKLMLAGAMGLTLDDLSSVGLRLGVVQFNKHAAPTMYDSDATDASKNRLRVAGIFYTNPTNGGTPTADTLNYVGGQYKDGKLIQYACQRNNTFVMTDGFANGDPPAPPSYSTDKPVKSDAFPYQTTTPESLADIALSYYQNTLRASAFTAGRVPKGNPAAKNADLNPNLHMNTYAMTLGVKGSIWPAITDPWANPFKWPAPVADDPTSIDDLWHATINGRGQMYVATSPEEAAANIRSALEDILGQTGAQSAVSVSSVNLRRGDTQAYLANYNPGGWGGDVTANPIDGKTGDVGTLPNWSAAVQMKDGWDKRVIATSTGDKGGTGFAGATVQDLVNPGGTYGASADVMNYLRGDPTYESYAPNKPYFRTRPHYDVALKSGTVKDVRMLMGGVIAARPTMDPANGVVYAASGEGMLHAFDSKTGAELWAYVPYPVLSTIGASTERSWGFETLLDGSPVLGKAGTKTLLVGGLGSAGAGYYAIDVTAPRGLNETALAGKVLWNFPGKTSAVMGVSVGKPLVVNTKKFGDVVVVTQGYNASTDGKSRVYVLDASSGALKDTFVADSGVSGIDPGLAQISAFVEDDGSVRYVYGGDEQGNLWRIDLETATAAERVKRLAKLADAGGAVQPVTAAPELVTQKGETIVLVGTGRLLGLSDFGASGTQTFFAIKDGTEITKPRTSLVKRELVGDDLKVGTAIDWAKERGWFFDLPAGQQANTDPTVAFGTVAFTTNMANGTDCTAASYLYAIDLLNGQNVPGMDYAMSSIGNQTASQVTIVSTLEEGLKAIFRKGDGDDGNDSIKSSGGVQARKNAWRQVLRD